MNRLSVRFFISHLMVAVVGGLVTFVLVRTLAPALFDQATHGLQGGPRGPGGGQGGGGMLRLAFASAVNRSLIIGVAVSALTAAVLSWLLTRHLLDPLRKMQDATKRLARGEYRHSIPVPALLELGELAENVNRLGGTLADTEKQRVRLLSEVAHEMRTPLTVINGYVEGMIDGVFDTDPERLGRISAEVNKLHRLTDDLSMLSRAEEGRLEIERIPLDLAEVVRPSAEHLRPQFEEAGIELEIRSYGPVPVRADAVRISQVVTNLLGNALRATSSGKVSVSTTHQGMTATIQVTDTGIGLAKADLERIFERFYRVSPKDTSEGSGIGLTIARNIMRAHDGDLVATSPGPDRGATFIATMPLER